MDSYSFWFAQTGFQKKLLTDGKQTKQDKYRDRDPEDTGQRCHMVVPVTQFQQFGVGGYTEEKYPQPFFDRAALPCDEKGRKQEEDGKDRLPFFVADDSFEGFSVDIEAHQEERQEIRCTGNGQKFSDIILIVDEGGYQYGHCHCFVAVHLQ